MQSNRISLIRNLLAVLGLGLLASCGGGGGGGDPAPGITGSATLASGVTVIPDAALQTLAVSQTGDGMAQVTLPDSAILSQGGKDVVANTVTVGTVIFIPPGGDSRFPFGLAGKVASASSSGGMTRLILDEVSLADVMSSSSTTSQPIPLTAENFIGVVAPRAVQSAQQGGLVINPSDMTALQGGVVVRSRKQLQQGVTSLGTSGTQSGGEIALNLTVKLGDMVDDPSTLKPYGSGLEASFVISGKLSNLSLTENHEFSITSGLKSMKLQVDGDLSVEAKLHGGMSADLGNFSRAWKEVDDETYKFLGTTAKMTGLDSKDKVGKYPVAGLVFSVPCASGCAVTPGQTQTPLRLAKMGGVIVWVYLTNRGTIELDGNLGVRLNGGHMVVGVQKATGGSLSGVGTLTPTTSEPLLQAPFLSGGINSSLRNGIAIDVDFFMLGVRVANGSLFAGAQVDMSLKTPDGEEMSYYTQDLNSPWQLSAGKYCYSARVGGGAQAAYATRFGTNFSVIEADLSASDQFPSEAEMRQPGWHGTWYAWPAVDTCAIAVTSKLPDSGITASQCYAAGSNGLVSCASAGAIALNDQQDGMLSINPMSYSLVAKPGGDSYAKTECVKDDVTGLIWEGKTDDGGMRDKDNTYTNYDDPTQAQKWNGSAWVNPTQAEIDAATNAKGYVDYVNGIALCGYTDWRLPTVDELQGIVDYGVAYPGPTIDGLWFPNTPSSSDYWSSSPDVGYSTDAWGVSFGYGFVYVSTRGYSDRVRLVRASQ